MKKLLHVSVVFLLLFASQVYAQNRTVTGTVTAKDDGLPLPGVSVRIQGAQTGTITGVDGKYSIKVPSVNTTLTFTYIGYATQSIATSGRSTINAVLIPNTNQLNEVVVTGVGTATEKRRVPIDVASVGSKDFAKSATTSVDQALVGQIAGAQVQQTTGQPGNQALIILRGFTNLGSAQPLILVDGVQVQSDVLTNLDPSVVDHIEVVKGSAGGMLYGAQGGNGVIQVFTKKGSQNGKLVIDFSSKVSVDNILRGKRPLNSQFHHYVTDANGNILDQNGNIMKPDVNGVWPDPQELPFASDPTVVNNKSFNLPTFDHISQSYRTAYTFQNSVNLRGGTENTDYAFGASNLQQQDVFSNNFNRTNVNLNLGFHPVKGLTFRNSTQLINTHEDLLGGNRFNLVNSYQWLDFKFKDPTGRYVVKPSDNIDGNNTLSERDWHQRYTNTPRVLENINVNYKFPKFLELDYKYSLDYRNADSYNYYLNQDLSLGTTYWSSVNANTREGSIQNTLDRITTQYQIASAYFRTDFKNDFHSNLPIRTVTQVSYDWRKDDERYYYALGSSLPPYPPATISGSATKTATDFYSSQILFGVLVNQTIDYGNLFGISGGFRSDYSSVFGSGSKPFTFPRGTIYFNPSELFGGHDFVTNWKLRAAYGSAGVPPSAFTNQITLNTSALGTAGSALTTPNAASNPALRVQVTKELEVGTDLTITPFTGDWLSRVTFNGTYWNRKSNDVVQNAPTALSTGYGSIYDNLVSLKSHGIDLSADVSAYNSSKFTWDISARFAIAKTYVTKIANGLPVINGAFSLREGEQVGIFYGQNPLHSINQTQPNGTRYISTLDAGNYTITDGNVVDTRTNKAVLTAANDLSVIGNATPKFTSSLINRFSFNRKISLSFQFDWIHGGQIYNYTRQWLYRDNQSKDYDTPVTINGKTGAFVAYYNSFYNTLNPVSWFVEDGSFIRLRDLSLSYDLTTIVHQKWLRSLVATASGRNLLTFTKYHGLDPENTSAVDSQGNGLTGSASYRGVDYFGIPNVKSYQFSLNFGF